MERFLKYAKTMLESARKWCEQYNTNGVNGVTTQNGAGKKKFNDIKTY